MRPATLDEGVDVAVEIGDVEQLLQVVRGDLALGLKDGLLLRPRGPVGVDVLVAVGLFARLVLAFGCGLRRGLDNDLSVGLDRFMPVRAFGAPQTTWTTPAPVSTASAASSRSTSSTITSLISSLTMSYS